MNNVDKQYCDLLSNIIENGYVKKDRTGTGTKSIFGTNLKFNLKEGFPLLTTKKIYMKGVVHELLWFLKGSTNIKYLVTNNVNIWNGDAYRYYKELVTKHNDLIKVFDDVNKRKKHVRLNFHGVLDFDHVTMKHVGIVTEEEFLSSVLKNEQLLFLTNHEEVQDDEKINVFNIKKYMYGDLGPVYGKMWRDFNGDDECHEVNYKTNGIDQIKNVIDTLLNKPNDRRIIVTAWHPSKLGDMALPPCHMLFQFYTRELSMDERFNILKTKNKSLIIHDDKDLIEQLDKHGIPKRELSCQWYQRSVDTFLGLPFNIASYALLTHMVAHVTNMTVGELNFCGGDTHVYLNHTEQVIEQISRNPIDKLPTLYLNPNVTKIDDFKYEDIVIESYESHPAIKAKLSVG